MNQALNDFYTKIKRGPALLLLGQDYLRLESGTDPFLSEILRKYDKISLGPFHYTQILEGGAHQNIESALAWMQERCDCLSTPQWLNTIAEFAWSGVYTSAIDLIWLRAFRLEWRDLQSLFEEKYRPNDPRNRSRLHCTFLFGRVDRTEEAERPPLTRFDWLKRKQVAVALARRLPELITPFGVLVIEGYAGERDWLSPEDLLPIIDELNPGQTHIFSVTEELTQNFYISDFVNKGKIVLHNESLATCLLQGETAGFLQLGRPPEEKEYCRRIQLGENIQTVPSLIWNQVSRSAMILDDTILIPSPPLSKEKRYYEFRYFLSESNAKPLWSGYKRGFAFSREFEKKLREEVDRRLKLRKLQNEPVILHGQTGTGKTVALGALAYEIRREKKHPVLFIERKSQKPLNSDIDTFCKWAEDAGALSTLVIWDGMIEARQYYDLLQYLVGRGRKVVVVGSCYRIDTKELPDENFIEAPACLNSAEMSKFMEFLNSFDSSLGHLIERWTAKVDDTFLVALYRLLPPTRSLIRSGVVREVGFAEQEIQRKAKEEKLEPIFNNVLGYALFKAGLITQENLLSPETKEIGGEKLSELQALIGLVMVSGRFGLKVPIELLLRALSKESILNFVDLLSGIDIFRWYEDSTGNIAVGPRNSLEAELFVQVRLGGARTEIDFAKQLLFEVKDSQEFLDNPEVQFAVDLIRSMGPNGRHIQYFSPYFRDLSETLGKLRNERGMQNSRLMLQEATLLRESVVEQSRAGMPPPDAEKLLDNAEKILLQVLELLESDRKNNNLRSMILVELGATLGSKARYILDYSAHRQYSVRFFQEARNQLFKARALDPENYYPIDVLAWTTRDLLRSKILDFKSQAEAEADILHAFEMAEVEDFGAVEHELFNKRRMEIGDLLGKQDMSEQAFEALLSQGSSAGYYFRASQIAGELASNAELTFVQRDRCRTAIKYLEENRQAIVHDGRCLYLLLRLWWMMNTGRPIFYGERQTVSFSQKDWQYCLGLILDLMATDELYITPSLRYLQGLATFHLGDIENAFEIFRELERESDYVRGRRRIIRSYIASMPDGRPKVFNGTVTWVNDERTRGEIYAEELRRNVRFIPLDFNRPDIQKRETLSGFHLAFNFIGPIADPPGYLKFQQVKE